MASLHRQLRDWCRRRGFNLCDEFTSKLDDILRESRTVNPEVLLEACRTVRSPFFRENRLDREEAAVELAAFLEMPRIGPNLVKLPGTGREDPDHELDLFVSYHHLNREFVRKLAKAVSRAGFTVWYDRLGLSAGKSFPRVIQSALERARFIGVVCTDISCERPWVWKEIEVGLLREGGEGRDILIPLRLEGCRLPLLMQSKDWADFAGAFEVGLENLLLTLKGA